MNDKKKIIWCFARGGKMKRKIIKWNKFSVVYVFLGALNTIFDAKLVRK